MRVALRPYAGPIAILALVLACLLVGVVIVLLGARQPSIISSNTDPPTEQFLGVDSPTLGKSWKTVGDWGVFDGTAALINPAPDNGLSSATVEGSASGEVAAKFVGIDGLGGLVFRYQDPDNYGMFLPLPQYGTWQVRVVQGGKVVLDHNIGLQSTAEGVIGEALFYKDTLIAVIDNRVIERVVLPAGMNGTRWGVGALPGGATATRFDNFVGIEKTAP